MSRNVTMISELPELEDLEPQIQKHIRVHKKSMEPQLIEHEQPVLAQQALERQSPEHQFMDKQNLSRQVYSDYNPASPLQYSCIDIAKHIERCPICSRFYHHDRTPYVVIIAILVILCLLLVKKILAV
jgi:hypothetical protein